MSILDNLFIAVSAVSTTGLVTVDPGSSYSIWGQIVILGLIQLGGIGYMTLGSFIILKTGYRISYVREEMTKTAFALPENLRVDNFLKSVVYFTLSIELVGAIILSVLFYINGVDNPIWSGIFHSISSFCTAGFSLNSNSLESFRDNVSVNMIVSILSILGSIGFIVFTDVYRRVIQKHQKMLFTSKVILTITFSFIVFGTIVLFLTDQSISGLESTDRFLVAFFQTVTASTTVGFNTTPISDLSVHIITLLYFFMLFGASPSGTGGGLKSTTFSALFALVKSTLTRRDKISFMSRPLPLKRIQFAAVSFIYCFLILGLSIFILSYTEKSPYEVIVFEAVSALGTVGLSMGLTGALTVYGKWVIIILMLMGRIGILTFGLALSSTDRSQLLYDEDNDLVL